MLRLANKLAPEKRDKTLGEIRKAFRLSKQEDNQHRYAQAREYMHVYTYVYACMYAFVMHVQCACVRAFKERSVRLAQCCGFA
jgi:hypothetical protein